MYSVALTLILFSKLTEETNFNRIDKLYLWIKDDIEELFAHPLEF